MNFEEYCSLKGLELWKAHGLTTGRVEENADLAFTRRVLDGKIQGHCRHARADNLAYYHNLGQNSMSLNDGSIKVQKRRAVRAVPRGVRGSGVPVRSSADTGEGFGEVI